MRLIAPDWAAPPQVQARVTTREGGVSAGPYADFNLATHVGDVRAAVDQNRARLGAALRLPSAPRWLSQVHGIRCVDAAAVADDVEADASCTTRQGVVCAVLTADCLPVLLCNRAGTRVAAVHAGWRGLYDGVIAATLASLAVPASTLLAWIGPGIGRGAYVVGSELRVRFLARDPGLAHCFEQRGAHWHADLAAIAAHQLAAAGVADITQSGLCTYADPHFYSYRRDGITGRFASLIWIGSSSHAP